MCLPLSGREPDAENKEQMQRKKKKKTGMHFKSQKRKTGLHSERSREQRSLPICELEAKKGADHVLFGNFLKSLFK